MTNPTKQEIIAGNVEISRFLKRERHTHHQACTGFGKRYKLTGPAGLHYDDSWDWLMHAFYELSTHFGLNKAPVGDKALEMRLRARMGFRASVDACDILGAWKEIQCYARWYNSLPAEAKHT